MPRTPDHLQPVLDGVQNAIDCEGVERIDWFAVAGAFTTAHADHLTALTAEEEERYAGMRREYLGHD